MDRHQPTTPPDGIPVSVLTGFLGSGKTTVLNHVLGDPRMAATAVIVNEFGEIGIDHLLVDKAVDDMVLLNSGCVCCSIRGDLVDTLEKLQIRRRRGEIPAFERVAIETSGLADPAPVLQTLMREPHIARHYRLAGMVATVDAVNGLAQLDTFDEARKQAALAGHLLVTKTDIADPATVDRLEARLRALNPSAAITRAVLGVVDPDVLFGDDAYDPPATIADADDWLNAGAYPGGHDHNHAPDIEAFCIMRDEPVPWPALRLWLDSVTSLRGADLLRVKGLVDIGDGGGPVVVHGVQHVFHPPTRLGRWPDGDRASRIVCITRGLSGPDLAAALDAAIEQMRT